MNRRHFLKSAAAAGAAAAVSALPAFAQETSPSAATIQRMLERQPRQKIERGVRATIEQIKRSPRLRDMAPSIDIQSINFAFASSRIPMRERWKIEQIAIAMDRILRRNPNELFLIEGHTDAVGSRRSNYILSEDRAFAVAQSLNRHFGVSRHALEPVGYGEDYLLVPTPNAEYRNRRVTLRRVTDLMTR